MLIEKERRSTGKEGGMKKDGCCRKEGPKLVNIHEIGASALARFAPDVLRLSEERVNCSVLCVRFEWCVIWTSGIMPGMTKEMSMTFSPIQ